MFVYNNVGCRVHTNRNSFLEIFPSPSLSNLTKVFRKSGDLWEMYSWEDNKYMYAESAAWQSGSVGGVRFVLGSITSRHSWKWTRALIPNPLLGEERRPDTNERRKSNLGSFKLNKKLLSICLNLGQEFPGCRICDTRWTRLLPLSLR